MSRVRVVVSDEQKSRWNKYVEENSEYDSVSDLVRKSVETEVQSSGDNGDEYDILYEIVEVVEDIQKRQARLQDSVDAHRQNSLSEDDMDALENVVIEALWEFSDRVRDNE